MWDISISKSAYMVPRRSILRCIKIFLSLTIVILISCASSEPEDYLKSYEYFVKEYVKQFKLNIDMERILKAKKSASEYYLLVIKEIEKGTYNNIELRSIDSLNFIASKYGLFKK
ncbi:MAG: hypothetical protein HGGPFJEG_02275 [Ignavibacteria bacterium]|nr:hypothetical protein [Ignavibacteria bacterium]